MDGTERKESDGNIPAGVVVCMHNLKGKASENSSERRKEGRGIQSCGQLLPVQIETIL